MRLLEIQATVGDLEAAAAFYEQTLELPVVLRGDVVAVTVGASRLTLGRGPTRGGGHHLAITVPATRFAQAKRWLAGRVPLLRRDGADEFALPAPWHSQSIYFTGPDDVLLELIARHQLRDNSTGPFSTDSLLGISEVGVAVDDVDAAATSVHEAFGLSRFDTGGPGFAPLGDHQGLLIVVSTSRAWFPTTNLVPSGAALTITLDAGSRSQGIQLKLGSCVLRTLEPL